LHYFASCTFFEAFRTIYYLTGRRFFGKRCGGHEYGCRGFTMAADRLPNMQQNGFLPR